jgi:hypothetical protein
MMFRAVFWVVLPCKMIVDNIFTRQYNPEDSSEQQYTTVKHSWKLLEHTYTSDLYGTGTLIPIGFFQQDLLWQSSNTHSHSCNQKASKHTRSIRCRAIGPLAHHNGTSAHSPSLACHLPASTIECLHRPPYKLTCSSRNFPIRT